MSRGWPCKSPQGWSWPDGRLDVFFTESPLVGCGARAQSHLVPSSQHLLVDGSNVLHAWPETRLLLKKDRDAARALLVQRLSAVHDAEGWRVTVVFDGRGAELSIEQPGRAATFAVVYTPSALTADDVIEQWIGKSTAPEECMVVTADGAERTTVRALGARWCTPAELYRWCEQASARQGATVAALRRTNDQAWRQ